MRTSCATSTFNSDRALQILQAMALTSLVLLYSGLPRYSGKAKQIVGSTLQDLKEDESNPVTNFESDKSAAEYAILYKEDALSGGHVIMLGVGADPLSKAAALEALHAYPDFCVAERTVED